MKNAILETLLGELIEIFHTSSFIHLGGDEMKFPGSWKKCSRYGSVWEGSSINDFQHEPNVTKDCPLEGFYHHRFAGKATRNCDTLLIFITQRREGRQTKNPLFCSEYLAQGLCVKLCHHTFTCSFVCCCLFLATMPLRFTCRGFQALAKQVALRAHCQAPTSLTVPWKGSNRSQPTACPL